MKRFCLAMILLLSTCVTWAAEEDEMLGFIVDDTISHIGHEFYYSFSERLRATSPMDFNLVVRERPSARWGSLVTVEYQQRLVYPQISLHHHQILVYQYFQHPNSLP